MARASYQHIPNLMLGQHKPKKAQKTVVKGATFSPVSSPYSSPIIVQPKPDRPILKLKY